MRHYGLLANGQRQSKLGLCRWLLTLLGVAVVVLLPTRERAAERRCPECGVGCLHEVEELPRPPRPAVAAREGSDDTS